MSNTFPINPRLDEVLARARAAITGTTTAPASITPTSDTLPAAAGLPRPAQRPAEAPVPTVRVAVTFPTALEVLGDRTLSKGAMALWQFAHDRAVERAVALGVAVVPAQSVYHLPAVIVAGALGYCERHVYRLVDELREAGVLDARGHVGQVGKLRRYDGTLWAVTLKPEVRPRLRWWDFQFNWRPDFAEDYVSEKGAFRAVVDAMSEPSTIEGRNRVLDLARRWVAVPGTVKTPVGDGSDMRPGRALQAVAYDLPGLIDLHPRHRHREVSRLAAEVAHALNEPGRFRQWCRSIYDALKAENEQRPGLHALALQLQRLATDLGELAPWKKPGAVLAARLRPA